MTIKPRGEYVLLEKIPETAEGILLVESTKPRVFRAKVLAIGNTVSDVSVGDTVYVPKSMEHSTSPLYLTPESQILGVEEQI